jgi:TPR repeat protein
VETFAGDLRRVERWLERAVLLDEDDTDSLYPLLLLRRAIPWLLRWAALDPHATRQRAESGDAVAQTYLGYATRFGRRVALDAVAAQRWFERAGATGFTEASIALGLMAWDYEADVDLEEAAAWFARAAKSGDPTALWGAAHCDGFSAEPSNRRGFLWALAGARQCHVRAAYGAAKDYALGTGVHANHREAARWMRVAAEGGLPEAQIWYGEMFADGKGVRRSARECVDWLRRAAEQGNIDAQLKLGVRLHEGLGVCRDDRECVRWYRRAAAHGDEKAMENLGLCFKNGHGVRKDVRAAMRCFRRAALVGDNPRGAYRLANAYKWGLTGRKDLVKTARWFTHGAAMGEAECLGELGIAYHEGEGVPKDHAFAALLYRAAAAKGNPWATHCLGLCYRDGEGVPKSRAHARAWFHRAARLGVKPALKALERLKSARTVSRPRA